MTTETFEEFLAHHGVKGMKWGVRKAEAHVDRATARRAAKAEKSEQKWEKRGVKTSAMLKAHNSAAREMNTVHVNRINSKPEYAKVNLDKDSTSPLAQKYMREFSDTFTKIMTNDYERQQGASPTGKRRVEFYADDNGGISYRLQDLRHADDPEPYPVTVENGKISGLEISELAHDFLAHYGVKGMKWGVRRDNPSGSGPQEVTITKNRRGKTVVKGGGGHGTSSDAVNTITAKQKAKASGISSLSDKELREAINRMNMEKQFAQLSQPELSPGQKFKNHLLGRDNKGQPIKGLTPPAKDLKDAVDAVIKEKNKNR